MYLDLLAALEDSWLGHEGRHSAWLYTASNLLHVLGAAFLVGGIAVFDLKVIVERGKHAWQVGRYAIPLAAAGLALQIPTGIILLAVEARALGINPAFYAKLALILIGLVNVALFHARFSSALHGGTLPQEARAYAVISLAAWILTLLAGRMIAYL
jgi:cation transporter-like permease